MLLLYCLFEPLAGRCGSCWAVSLCGAIEGAAFSSNGYLQSMSFQQFVSCNERNLGCDGGNLVIASLYATLTSFGGVVRLNDYEYTDYRGFTTEECFLSSATPVAVEVSSPTLVTSMTSSMTYQERAEVFKQVLEQQPIAMVIKSSCKVSKEFKPAVLCPYARCIHFSSPTCPAITF